MGGGGGVEIERGEDSRWGRERRGEEGGGGGGRGIGGRDEEENGREMIGGWGKGEESW